MIAGTGGPLPEMTHERGLTSAALLVSCANQFQHFDWLASLRCRIDPEARLFLCDKVHSRTMPPGKRVGRDA